jgi:hypothetical protein
MDALRIRIWIDGQDNFIREVQIKSNQYFKDLHVFLVKSLGLDARELASFHIADDNWKKAQEISLIDMWGKSEDKNQPAQKVYEMGKTRLDTFLMQMDQKLIYEYDFLQMHTFKLEVVDITGVDEGKKYPYMATSYGTLQLQQNVEVEDDAEKLKQELLDEFSALQEDDDDYDFGLDDDQ